MMNNAEAAKLLAPGNPGEPSNVTEAVEFHFIAAVMESIRLASRDIVKGKIIAFRDPDLAFQTNNIITHMGWVPVTI